MLGAGAGVEVLMLWTGVLSSRGNGFSQAKFDATVRELQEEHERHEFAVEIGSFADCANCRTKNSDQR